MIRKITSWIKNGNGCENCPAGWSTYSCDEWDGGCYIFGDDWPEVCHMPRWLARLLARRGKHQEAHEYDTFGSWWDEQEKKKAAYVTAFQKAIKEITLNDEARVFLCRENTDGTLHKYSEIWLGDVLWCAESKYSDYLSEREKRTLPQRWRELLKLTADKTIMRPIRFILSYIIP